MTRPRYTATPGLLAKLAVLPKATIINWLSGVVARPRRWHDLIRVADALRLSEAETNELLTTAEWPPLAEPSARVTGDEDVALLATVITSSSLGLARRRASVLTLPRPPVARDTAVDAPSDARFEVIRSRR